MEGMLTDNQTKKRGKTIRAFFLGQGPDVGLPIPVERAAQAVGKIHGGEIAEQLASEPDVGLGVAYIAFARRVVFRFEPGAADFAQEFQGLIERNAFAGANVADSSAGGRSFASEQRGLHNVVDVGEVARLFAVAINYRFGSLEKSRTEFGEHPGIR